ncbi:nuclear pore complex protein Nup50 isoform X2 [Trichomycterus rosablanca]|uniref:nuclear pore complex protein Nup50 isoform X2 n=1 Tax=Trichomycterus rosablanca TaxID=2290929 RepID=UPI002F356FCE
MAKRIADKELTDRNWDQEDEEEEAGMFSPASAVVMKSRAIKKAKRRNPGTEAESGGAFKAFKGFSLTSATPATQGAFSGFGNGAGLKPNNVLTNGSATSVIPTFGGFGSSATTKANTGTSSSNGLAPSTDSSGVVMPNGSTPSQPASSGSSSSSKEYNRQLTALNYSVRDWITKHVNDNPLCDLNPIFRDYERHLATIESKYGSSATAGEQQQPGKQANSTAPTLSLSSSSFGSSSNATSAVPALFSFTKNKDEAVPEKSSTPAGVTFNFGKKVDSSVFSSLGSTGVQGFSFSPSSTPLFGGVTSTGTAASTLSFTPAKTETASNSQAADENGADEESEEPPVPVVKEIKEKDAFYSKKCKLFYKKENEFKEKGVGTLHLKIVSEGKLQLLVRADTNLGNILLNIMVPSTMPCTRTGKNNVMVVCVPNPSVDDKNPNTPVPMLIRVKTAEDADELHKILQEKKA